jgi:hypothetical protein
MSSLGCQLSFKRSPKHLTLNDIVVFSEDDYVCFGIVWTNKYRSFVAPFLKKRIPEDFPVSYVVMMVSYDFHFPQQPSKKQPVTSL